MAAGLKFPITMIKFGKNYETLGGGDVREPKKNNIKYDMMTMKVGAEF